jgi:hypothetical protein
MPAGPSQQGFCRAGNRASIVDALFYFAVIFDLFRYVFSHLITYLFTGKQNGKRCLFSGAEKISTLREQP